MSRKRSIERSHHDFNNDAMEAQHMIQLLDTILGELDGMDEMLSLFRMLLDRHYPRHVKVRRMVDRVKRSEYRLMGEVVDLTRQYKHFVENHEHQYGHENYPSLQSLANYSISLGELLEHFPMSDIVEDFLDG